MALMDIFKSKSKPTSEKNWMDGSRNDAAYNTLEGGFSSDWAPTGWFQTGARPHGRHTHNPDVAAAISLYKRALTACPIKHIVRNKDGAGLETNRESPLSQVLNRPNSYMSTSEFMGVIIDDLLRAGEFACLIEEDSRGNKTTVHPLSNFEMVAAEDGSIFYRVQLSEPQRYALENPEIYVPQRNIVHGRYEVDPRNHMKALNPLYAYANSIGLGSILRAGQEAFHNNKGQPSGIISTDQTLTAEQATRLRDRWNEMSQRMKNGETPILSNGLRWQGVSVSANEGQVIQLLSMTTKDIAKAFGIPPILLGENSGVTYSNLEQLIAGWRTTGLLSLCMLIERSFEFAFDLPEHEEMIIDISDLARASALENAGTMTSLVQNGLMTPNEARAKLDLYPLSGVAGELVSQSQIKPMQQTHDLALREADRADKVAAAQMEASDAKLIAAQKRPEKDPEGEGNIPTPVPHPKDEEQNSIDTEVLSLMLKGILK